MTNLDSILKSRDITLPTKVHLVKAMVFPVVTYGCELNYKEGWVLERYIWTVVLKKILESSLDYKEMKPVNSKRNQLWIFIWRTDAEASVLWPPNVKSWLFGKNLDLGKDWWWEQKRATEDEMVGCHHRLNVHEFEWTPGNSEGQGILVCCNPRGHEE